MENAIEIKGLCKAYKRGFSLGPVDLCLPRGCVLGLVGENGAGKTTLLKSLLRLVFADSGQMNILGLPVENEVEIKQKVGIVMDESYLMLHLTIEQTEELMKRAYAGWDSAVFEGFLQKFNLTDRKKKIKDFSKGMRAKLMLALAMSHGAELLLLDEPTGGLDPIARDEILALLYDFMQDERHAILFSSHITSDLDKIADRIALLHQGRLLFDDDRSHLLEDCALLKCSREQLSALPSDAIRAVRHSTYGSEAWVRRDRLPAGTATEAITIEQIMLLLTKGEAR